MKKFSLLLLLLLTALPLAAREQKVRDIDIKVVLSRNGTALIHERWNVDTGDRITEWYLVRSNLGDIEITDFSVTDDVYGALRDDGEWDVDRTLQQKKGRYGIVHKRNGVELCWGIGSYGEHVFDASYKMTRAVKSLNDYDILHLQLVSPGLAAPPLHVRVTIEIRTPQCFQLDTTSTRVWGFGFDGRSGFEKGRVVFESTGPFDTEDSVIALLRFEKGLFDSPSVQERDFEEVLAVAMTGADFHDSDTGDEEDDTTSTLAALVTLIIMYFAFIRPFFRLFSNKPRKADIRRVIGISNPKAVDWWREIPFGQDLDAAEYTLDLIEKQRRKGGHPLALILRMIHQGYLQVNRELEGQAEIRFTERDPGGLDETARELYRMLKEASGSNRVLEDKEFSTWAKAHDKRVYRWSTQVATRGRERLQAQGCGTPPIYTREGQVEARRLLGLRKFLSEFTLIDQREAFEAGLWKEYLVYGALFGIADRVARQLKDIDPRLFEETFHCDYASFGSAITLSESLASSLRAAASSGAPVSSYSSSGGSSSGGSSRGYGGSTSRSGGGGYSGGGRGGGGR